MSADALSLSFLDASWSLAARCIMMSACLIAEGFTYGLLGLPSQQEILRIFVAEFQKFLRAKCFFGNSVPAVVDACSARMPMIHGMCETQVWQHRRCMGRGVNRALGAFCFLAGPGNAGQAFDVNGLGVVNFTQRGPRVDYQ